MRRLNRLWRSTDRVTDVLAFRLKSTRSAAVPGQVAGEVLICWPQVVRQAKERRSSPGREFQILAIHGILHVLGYDHEQSASAARKMAAAEKRLLSRLPKV